ncbi:MAG: glycogen/starch synthase, partial [Chloroflexota bacterium]
MNILFVTAEASPFAKVGGLGDVIAAGSLPTALRHIGMDARVVMPLYGTINYSKYNLKPYFTFTLPRRDGDVTIQIHHTVWHDVPFYFIESWPFFGEEHTVYTGWEWDMGRFVFFCQAAMAVSWELKQREEWFPNIFHVNDWHTGLIPFFLKLSANEPFWGDVRSMISLHNVAYQGEYVSGFVYPLGIPDRNHPVLKRLGLSDNMLATGIAYSDFVSTVSPRYADEIQYPYMGYGLDELIRARADEGRLYGILNGIDVAQFDPATDKNLAVNYDETTFEAARKENKRRLQLDAGLEVRDDVPVIGIVSRIVQQKGLDLAIPALRRLLEEEDEVQLIALGTGELDLSHALWQLGHDFFYKARTFIMYDPAIAQRIYAGADLFLMPSHYEPCGIGQMIAMRYGSLPVVRETGGLADTVDNYDNGDGDIGTGFVFQWEEADAVYGTLRWALD